MLADAVLTVILQVDTFPTSKLTYVKYGPIAIRYTLQSTNNNLYLNLSRINS